MYQVTKLTGYTKVHKTLGAISLWMNSLNKIVNDYKAIDKQMKLFFVGYMPPWRRFGKLSL